MNRADIQRHIIEGPTLAVAIAVDTCIFEQHGFRFEAGQLKHLEQFKGTPGVVLMSDVVRREVLAHMTTAAVKAKSKLKSALEEIRDHWPTAAAAPALTDVLGTGSKAEAVAAERLDAFLQRCGGETVNAGGRVDIADVMERYFRPSAPFEKSGEKKHEFPDAVALMALESWAAEHGKRVLLVSNDKGWQAFAEASDRLCGVTELSEALEMFQRRDATRAEMVAHVGWQMDAKGWDGLDEVANLLNLTEWVENASAMCDYELDLHVDVESVELVSYPAVESLRAIDYSGGALTVIAEFEAKVAVDATFDFHMEGVDLGSCVVSETKTVNFEALITFDEPGSDELVTTDIELVRRAHKLDFGYVQPDYSDQDPTFEKY